MPRALIAIAAFVVPVAIVGTLELLFTIVSAQRADLPYAARFAGQALLLEMVLGVALGSLFAIVTVRRREESPAMDARAVALGLTVALLVLFLAANGIRPFTWRDSLAVARSVSIAGIAGVVVAWAWRFAERVFQKDRSFSALRMLSIVTVVVAAGLAITAISAGRTSFGELSARGADAPDVLLVVLDTTRADFAPAPPGSALPTPWLERLAAAGTRFDNAVAVSCWTLPSHASLFTGLPPALHGATWRAPRLIEGLTTLAERFSAAGWRTGGFSPNPWITHEFGFDQGFDRFVESDQGDRPLCGGLVHFVPSLFDRLNGATLFRDAGGWGLASEALRFLGADDRPAFVFLNLMEPHLPYAPPRPFPSSLGWDRRALYSIDQDRLADLDPARLRSAKEIEGLRRLYAGEMAYVDELLGRMIGRLEEAGRLDSTLVVVAGDHGENLGQHPPLDHQLGLWDSLVRVPLIVRYPAEVPAGVVSDALVSLSDVHDAVLALAGIEPGGWSGSTLARGGHDQVFLEYDRPDYLLGRIRDLVGVDPAPWDRSLRGIRTRDLKWIESSDGRHEGYDLARDPDETVNLAASAGTVPAELVDLSSRLRAVFEALPARASEPAGEPPSEEALERLRSLGYVE